LVQAFPKKWWVESYFKAPNLQLSLRFKGSGCHYNSIYSNTGTKYDLYSFISCEKKAYLPRKINTATPSPHSRKVNVWSLGQDRIVLWDILVLIYCWASVRLWMFIVIFDSNLVIRWRLVSFINAVMQSSRRKLPTCCKTLTNYHVSQTTRRKLPTYHK